MADSRNTSQGAKSPAVREGLAQSTQELLDLSMAVLQGFQPEPGALHDIPQITVAPGDLAQVCRLAKGDSRLALKQLLCLACVDYREHFQLVYLLHSLEPDRMLAIRTNVPYSDPKVPSVTSVWRAAEWYEREAHDLFGVVFVGHPNLEPLLLYEGFEGYPGRKEFPFYDYQEF
ncbi:MAG: NADH-quinone oxidoreductase subunit C [Chloroflexota bacterium]